MTFASKRKEVMALAAGLPIVQNREDVSAGGLAATGIYQCENSLKMRQVFMAGPDDE